MPDVPLEPVDSVHTTTLVDNANAGDMLLADQGPAKRPGRGGTTAPRLPAAFLEGGEAASCDAGLTSDGLSENSVGARFEL